MTHKIFCGVVAALLAVAALQAPALAQNIQIEHAQGKTTLAAVPKKVVVFDAASLDTLSALDVDVAGIAKFKLPDFLSRYAETPQVGSLFEPDYEAVAAIEPDLIIVGGRSAAKYSDLAKIAPTIDMTVDRTRFIESVKMRAQTLAHIFGKDNEAAALIGKLDEAIAEVRKIAPHAGKALFVMTNGAKVIAFGPGSRFGWIHDDLGILPVASDIKAKGSHGEVISFEFILEKNPDALLVLDRDAAVGADSGASATKTLDNELVAQTKAWINKKVILMDARRMYIVGSGLPSTTALVQQIRDGIER